MSAASSARVLQVEGAIHTSEVAVNGRSASPWAAAGTAAARVRSSKIYGLRSKGILLAKEGNGDLSEVSGEHHKAWRMEGVPFSLGRGPFSLDTLEYIWIHVSRQNTYSTRIQMYPMYR